MACRWAAIIVNDGVTATQAEEFLERVVRRANDSGFGITPPARYDRWNDPTTEARSLVVFYRQNRCKHAMFFRDGEDASRHVVRRYVAEIAGQVQTHEEFNMTTQCIARSTVERVLEGDETILNLVVGDLLAYF